MNSIGQKNQLINFGIMDHLGNIAADQDSYCNFQHQDSSFNLNSIAHQQSGLDNGNPSYQNNCIGNNVPNHYSNQMNQNQDYEVVQIDTSTAKANSNYHYQLRDQHNHSNEGQSNGSNNSSVTNMMQNMDINKMSNRSSDVVILNEGIVCQVCLSANFTDDNQIIVCEYCLGATHQSCYGRELDKGYLDLKQPFLCERCHEITEKNLPYTHIQCMYCSDFRGIMRKLKNKSWVHFSCVNWIPEIYPEDDVEIIKIVGKLRESRKNRKCYICNKLDGQVCIGCDYYKCIRHFHIRCGIEQGILRPLDDMEGQRCPTNEFNYAVFCPDHEARAIQEIQTKGFENVVKMRDFEPKVETKQKHRVKRITQYAGGVINSKKTIDNYDDLDGFVVDENELTSSDEKKNTAKVARSRSRERFYQDPSQIQNPIFNAFNQFRQLPITYGTNTSQNNQPSQKNQQNQLALNQLEQMRIQLENWQQQFGNIPVPFSMVMQLFQNFVCNAIIGSQQSIQQQQQLTQSQAQRKVGAGIQPSHQIDNEENISDSSQDDSYNIVNNEIQLDRIKNNLYRINNQELSSIVGIRQDQSITFKQFTDQIKLYAISRGIYDEGSEYIIISRDPILFKFLFRATNKMVDSIPPGGEFQIFRQFLTKQTSSGKIINESDEVIIQTHEVLDDDEDEELVITNEITVPPNLNQSLQAFLKSKLEDNASSQSSDHNFKFGELMDHINELISQEKSQINKSQLQQDLPQYQEGSEELFRVNKRKHQEGSIALQAGN
ncbi:phd zinc finger-containing protein [Stylonychia lemnae]|uniref:Phd zinc finger-containing protein n=1 Tax=Stylonychia lemnae TaxID=5949 RepID=A0A077ZTN1_STYLE|nr:phd zinc finger-containing protein [Stylonychia lemnae]|eukprot:CDW72695.1 phd zinc finger-containing protein [Stylonychia lemnae]